MGNSMLFGGKTMLLSGDFRQILPVIPKASDTQIMKACISYSDLWQYFNILKLTKNMRVQQKGRTLDFPEFLLSIGNGTHKKNSLLDSDYFKMPEEFILPATKDSESNIRSLIDFVYEDIRLHYQSPNYFSDRVILAPLCAVVRTINNNIMNELPGESSKYCSNNN